MDCLDSATVVTETIIKGIRMITLAPFSNSFQGGGGVFLPRAGEFPARFIKTFNFVYYAFVTLIRGKERRVNRGGG